MSSTHNKFPPINRDKWRAAVMATMKKMSLQSLNRTDEDGLEINALYEIPQIILVLMAKTWSLPVPLPVCRSIPHLTLHMAGTFASRFMLMGQLKKRTSLF